MNAKKVLAGSLLTLAATGFAASPAMASDEQSFSQNIQIIDDICPTIQDIDVLTVVELLDEARVNQCHDMKKSAIVDNSDAPALALLGAVS
ncbi:hypothetical protein J7E91_22610 [Streptomyces sp. ISL-99]|uniref:hypothetical protein n=1 Tax=Streptomyces sp. ISL-99 TaxID=2819193 RepID=UPI001BEAC430|nr:hypothetical protein [Streptomyces sp. ISL-99]MBT2528132.1 hypothetical protein [Streptomyces sp. ISL-99]